MNPFKNLKLDPEEQEIIEAVDNDRVKQVKDVEQEIKRFQEIAKYTQEKTNNINLRLPQKTILKLKAKASAEGIPYQTLMSSVLHKYANQ